jgi:hypothetical protein
MKGLGLSNRVNLVGSSLDAVEQLRTCELLGLPKSGL